MTNAPYSPSAIKMATTEEAHGWLLHHRAYGNTSLILELFTLEQGRLDLMAKGGRKNLALQPFSPLWLRYGARGKLPSLYQAEATGQRLNLAGTAFWCGFYLNELVLRLLPKGEPSTALFSRYGQTLDELATGRNIQAELRQFEWQLLADCGYQLLLDTCCNGEPVRPEAYYRFTEDGLVTASKGFAGKDLLGFARGDWSPAIARTSLQLMRQALGHRLGGKPLKSREMLQRMRQHTPTDNTKGD